MRNGFWDRRIVPALVFGAMMAVAALGVLFSVR
jgi:hypothetical protein